MKVEVSSQNVMAVTSAVFSWYELSYDYKLVMASAITGKLSTAYAQVS